jgi:hypothetical protein
MTDPSESTGVCLTQFFPDKGEASVGIWVISSRSFSRARADRADAILDVLASQPNRVAASQTGIEQNVEPNSLLGSYGPFGLIPRNIFLGPSRKSGAFLPRRIAHPGSRVDRDVTGLKSPPE